MTKYWIFPLVIVLLSCLPVVAQTATSSEELSLKITGAVKQEKTLSISDLEKLASTQERVKIGSSTNSYLGTFEANGVEFSRILEANNIVKKSPDGFDRELDMYIIAISRNGKKAVFSYGEIFLGNNANGILLTKGLRFIYPHKHTDTSKFNWSNDEWFSGSGETAGKAEKSGCFACHNGSTQQNLYFPKGICLAAAHDSWPGRFIEDVIEIKVCQSPAAEKEVQPQNKDTMWVEKPEIIFPDGKKIEISSETLKGQPKITMNDCCFGLGKGFHGLHAYGGYALTSILKQGLANSDLNQLCVLVTSADGYRSLFSGGEVFLSKNPENCLLLESEDQNPLKPGNGKYKVFLNSDFFVDRCLRSIAKIQCFIP
ncbi:MAG: hypothetical protein HQM08_23065 [Candidatus Riflebacteria bacterium]|nr:hypothetical protein [Candidatus Riflebacteria bacterium]